MPRTVSASEAKTRFGEMATWIQENRDDIIVESRGKPNVVIVSFEEYQKILDLRERARREELLSELESLRSEVSARNQDLSEDEALALGELWARETIAEMIREGKIKYGGS